MIMNYDVFYLSSVTPLVTFHNADVQKWEIVKQIKAGIYRWINNNNAKSYSVDLSKPLGILV